MKVKILISTTIILLCLAGCKTRERIITITEDRNYTACGVTDPIANLPWLADTVAVALDKARNDDHFYGAYINLYQHKTEDRHLIGVQFTYYSQLDCCCECGPIMSVYTCSKECIAVLGNNAAPFPEFKDNYERVTRLWSIKVIDK
ncbi:MAG: hypothetical protein LBD21_05500 [Tannerellaceae bacterium]|jgi:hypothetical protein|nr:hypothetical protein [Tannerellaceae bacterium]